MNQPDKRKILIAEDVQSIRKLAVSFLEKAGYEVEGAANGEEALTKARQWRPNLILLDLMMPKMHGMEVLSRIKADPQTRAIGVIMFTGKQYKSDEDEARALGACGMLFKPFGPDELLATVARFFENAPEPEPVPRTAIVQEYLPSIAKERSYCRFWGTRGSIPVSCPRCARHGGNTSCVEIGCGEEMLIIDAGTGIRQLGQNLAAAGPRRLHILITHTHWDHIQGFPFFAPAYIPGFELVFYSARGFKKDLRQVFRGQLDSDYFPIQFEDMRATFEFRTLEPRFEINGFEITWEYTHHPAATVAFKFARNGRTLGYCSDNEFLYGYLGRPHDLPLDSEIVAVHRPLIDLLAGTDVLVAEAQYLNSEYPSKIGWGHSSLSNACALARFAESGKWVVTHHEPLHEDDMLDAKLNLTRAILDSMDCGIEAAHAHDGWTEYW